MDKYSKESQISLFKGTTYTSPFPSSSSTSKENDDDDSSLMSEDFGYTAEEDAIEWVVKNEAYCFNLEKFSEKLVSATIVEANKHMSRKKNLPTVLDIIQPLIRDILTSAVSIVSDYRPYEGSSAHVESNRSIYGFNSEEYVDWPKISEFNIKLGLEKLEDYVSTWKRSKEWLYCVEFLGFESEECSNIFVYEVEWSQPTNAYPIPQATASVYFALEVLKMVPYNHDRCIEVTYVFETSNVIHSPGKINFQEKWLDAIINAKERAFKSLVFSVSSVLTLTYDVMYSNMPRH